MSSLEIYLLSLTTLMGQGIQGTPVFTTSAGTAAGATETLDSVLGVYQFNATAGRRYFATMNNLMGSGTAGELYSMRIRDSGTTSNPTNASTLLATSQWECQTTGGGGQASIVLGGSFLAGTSGTHTLGMFAVRISGGANVTPVSGTLARELYVVDLGVF